MNNLTKKQVRKLYMENLLEWNSTPTKKEIKGQMELADLSWAENEGCNK